MAVLTLGLLLGLENNGCLPLTPVPAPAPAPDRGAGAASLPRGVRAGFLPFRAVLSASHHVP